MANFFPHVYLLLYTTIGSMAEQVTSGIIVFGDSIFLSSLKIAVAYNKALMRGRLTSSRGGIIQSIFIASLEKRVEDILNHSRVKVDLPNYLNVGDWPDERT